MIEERAQPSGAVDEITEPPPVVVIARSLLEQTVEMPGRVLPSPDVDFDLSES